MKCIYILLLASSLAFAGPTLKPHVHGVGKITLALESPTSGTLELDCPGDSIMGFEHEARTEADKNAQNKAFDRLRNQPDHIVIFDEGSGCTVTTKDVGLEKGEENSKHKDINASYTVVCAKALSGTKVHMGIMDLFPKIKKLSFEVLGDAGQKQATVESSHESISLP